MARFLCLKGLAPSDGRDEHISDNTPSLSVNNARLILNKAALFALDVPLLGTINSHLGNNIFPAWEKINCTGRIFSPFFRIRICPHDFRKNGTREQFRVPSFVVNLLIPYGNEPGLGDAHDSVIFSSPKLSVSSSRFVLQTKRHSYGSEVVNFDCRHLSGGNI